MSNPLYSNPSRILRRGSLKKGELYIGVHLIENVKMNCVGFETKYLFPSLFWQKYFVVVINLTWDNFLLVCRFDNVAAIDDNFKCLLIYTDLGA